MNCIIVDDEEMARKHLANLCNKMDELNLLAECEDSIQAISQIEKEKVDLVFLDIEMPEFSGIELIKSVPNMPAVIFTTAKTDFAIEAFEYNVIDYLVKPIELPRFIKAIEKVKKQFPKTFNQKSSEEFFVRSEGKLVKILYSNIIFIETMDDYLVIHLEKGEKHIIHSTLKAMDDKLQDPSFIKVHRSYIVNLLKIRSIEDTHVLVEGKVIPVSKQHRKELMERITLL